jgi:hypothetical protein
MNHGSSHSLRRSYRPPRRGVYRRPGIRASGWRIAIQALTGGEITRKADDLLDDPAAGHIHDRPPSFWTLAPRMHRCGGRGAGSHGAIHKSQDVVIGFGMN